MYSRFKPIAILAIIGGATQTATAGSVGEAIEASKVDGNFRTYYNTRSYDTKTDESALAVGGALRVKTGGRPLPLMSRWCFLLTKLIKPTLSFPMTFYWSLIAWSSMSTKRGKLLRRYKDR